MNDEVFLQANTNTVGVVICLQRDADCLAESWTSYVTVVFQLQSGLCLIGIVFLCFNYICQSTIRYDRSLSKSRFKGTHK